MNVCVVTTSEFIYLVDSMINQKYVNILALITNDRIFAFENGCRPKDRIFAMWQFQEVVQKFQMELTKLCSIYRRLIFRLQVKIFITITKLQN